jgi:copper(I)-binding protein
MIAACGASSATTSGPDIAVEGPWARSSPKMAEAGAAYMILTNNGSESDRLLSASTEAAEVVEFHESFMDENQVMKMRPIEGGVIEVPAGSSIELKPGGMHLMLIKLVNPLEEGTQISLILNFEKSGEMSIELPVSQEPPAN